MSHDADLLGEELRPISGLRDAPEQEQELLFMGENSQNVLVGEANQELDQAAEVARSDDSVLVSPASELQDTMTKPPLPPPRPPAFATSTTPVLSQSIPDGSSTRRPSISLPARTTSAVFLNVSSEAELESHMVIRALKTRDPEDELIDMLQKRKAVLFLPLADSLLHVTEEGIPPTFFEHHVFIANPENPKQVMSLGGVRGLLKGSRLIVIGPRPTEEELSKLVASHESGQANFSDRALSMWDTIDVTSTTIDHYPSIELMQEHPFSCHISNDVSIDVLLMSRAIMQEDLVRHQIIPKISPRRAPSYNTSLITLPTFNLDITSIPSNVFTQIGSIPALFAKEVAPLDDPPCLQGDHNYRIFAEQMRDPRCSHFIMDVQRYLTSLASHRGVLSSDSLAMFHARFLESMHKAFGQNSCLRAKDSAIMDAIVEGLDSYLLAKAYPIYFTSVLAEEQHADLLVHRKISLMSVAGFGLEQLGLTGVVNAEALRDTVKYAGIELLSADRLTTPAQKLAAIVASHHRVADRVSACFPTEDESSSADMLLPLLIYVVIRTNMPRLVSCLKYITKFRPTNKMEGYAAYCLTNLSAVQSFLETCDVENLNLDQDFAACFRPLPSNPHSDTVIVLPHSLIQLESKIKGKMPPAPSLRTDIPPISDKIASLPASMGLRISGMWPFWKGPVDTPSTASDSTGAAGSTGPSAPSPESAGSTQSDQERLWARLRRQ
ncbi:hypothetical protein DFS34DRAFT_294778 [Phlyctochytrium arcticum]|nr:hypothetical protein DFS34DRAFT_294778 [Phlyctochytrium arcticum]